MEIKIIPDANPYCGTKVAAWTPPDGGSIGRTVVFTNNTDMRVAVRMEMDLKLRTVDNRLPGTCCIHFSTTITIPNRAYSTGQ
jgi:hypothetical protein